MKRTVYILKVSRLIVSIMIIITIVFYQLAGNIYVLPSQELVMTLFFSVFVFILGIQYHLEKKQGRMGLFLMLFSIMMAIMTVIGFVL
jgi:hypothetical protein